MKTAMIPLGACTIGLGLGLAIAAWRGDLTVHEAARPPLSLSARSAAQPSRPGDGLRPGAGLSRVADARSVRPAPARFATPAAQPVLRPSARLLRADGPAAADANAADDSLPDESSSAIGEPQDAESFLGASDRAAAHSARSR